MIVKTAKEVNASFPAVWSSSYKPDSKVIEFTTSKTGVFVRVYGETNKAQNCPMREPGARGLSPEQIKAKYSIPELPKYVSKVTVLAGTRIRSGRVNSLSEFGAIDVNAKQLELLQRLPEKNFTNTKK